MTRLLLADVHANLPAFQAVLADAPPVDEILFLGDIVGYGPHPAQCVETLRTLKARCILGNHDTEILQLREQISLSEKNGSSPHHVWLHWTLARLAEEHITFLGSLPTEYTLRFGETPVRVVHGTPGVYLHERMPDAEVAQILSRYDTEVVVCGHAHRAIDRTVNGRRLVCIPAIGQPRDGDPRAGYALETEGHIEFRRVPYDVETVACDICAMGLPGAFEERWLRFLRTGHDPEWSRDRPISTAVPSPDHINR